MERIKAIRQVVVAIDRLEAAIEVLKQAIAILELLEAEAGRQRDAANAELGSRLSASIAAAPAASTFNDERVVGRAEVAGKAREAVTHLAKGDVGRNALRRRQQLGDERTDGGILERSRRLVAGRHEDSCGAMRRDRVGGRANDRALVHHLAHQRHVLADANALSAGVNGAEFAADPFGRFGLEVPHIDGSRPTGEPDHDDGLGTPCRTSRLLRGASLGGEHAGQAKTEQPGGADLNEVAPAEPFAIGVETSHDRILRRPVGTPDSHLPQGLGGEGLSVFGSNQ